ncbi:MAG: stalk domain-containing protein [Eubacteriales bacterium]|nr:stalk domain-containing protein [Eubacteriales bacterium]
MKKTIAFMTMIMIVLSLFSVNATAQGSEIVMLVGNQQMLVNGEVKPISTSSPVLYPYIFGDRVLVPLRAVSEAFGAQVGWDGANKTASISYNGNSASIIKGEGQITINGQSLPLDVNSEIIYGSFFLPLRVVAENILGKHIEYVVNETGDRVVIITDEPLSQSALDTLAIDGAKRLNNAVDSDKNGLYDGYYYINGRAYNVKEHAKKQGGLCTVDGCPLKDTEVDIPIISFNYKLTGDPIIKSTIEADLMSLMEPIEINGQTILVRREAAAEAKLILDEISKGGYKINDVHSFRLAEKDFVSSLMAKARDLEEGIMHTAFHPNGLAIDINPAQNPLVYSGSNEYAKERQLRYSLTDPLSPEIHFNGHIVAETFKKHGWEWGLWTSSSDYMHFSLGEY